MSRFEITIKNTKLRSYHRLAWIIAFMVFVIELVFTFFDPFKQNRILVVTILGVMLLLLIVGRGAAFNFKDKKEYIGSAYVFLCMPWLTWQLYWVAILIFLFYLLYTVSVRRFEVILTDKEISYPSFPIKKIRWNELNNVLMKDDLLTIDFKNDKLIQAETEGDDFFDEKKFNDFCQTQLRAAN